MNKKILFAVSFLCLGFTACKSTTVDPVEKEREKNPIFRLFKENKIDEVRSRFEFADDINGIDEEGNTILHLAAAANDSDLCLFFLIKGADPELKNYNGDTPLHLAIKKGCLESAETIVSQNQACIFARDGNGIPALTLGLETSPSYYGVMINDKTVKSKDSEDNTILHYFVQAKNVKAIEIATALNLDVNAKMLREKLP